MGKEPKKFLTREEIKSKDDLQSEVVDVPEWGGAVKVREMTIPERLKWIEGAQSEEDESEAEQTRRGVTASAQLVILTVVKETGEPVFSDADEEWLLKKSPTAMDRVAKVALRLSGVGGDAEAEGKDDLNAMENGSS